jgi:hypothetical protein
MSLGAAALAKKRKSELESLSTKRSCSSKAELVPEPRCLKTATLPQTITSPSVLYFARKIGFGNLLKIGTTTEFHQRRTTHASAGVYVEAYVYAAGYLEHSFHMLLRHQKASCEDGAPDGEIEWFKGDLTPESVCELYWEKAVAHACARVEQNHPEKSKPLKMISMPKEQAAEDTLYIPRCATCNSECKHCREQLQLPAGSLK